MGKAGPFSQYKNKKGKNTCFRTGARPSKNPQYSKGFLYIGFLSSLSVQEMWVGRFNIYTF